MLKTKSLECYLGKSMLHACFLILLFMYKSKISRWVFKVVFLEMRILRIRQYVMWPTKCGYLSILYMYVELLETLYLLF